MHLIERAAEQLLKSGAAPSMTGAPAGQDAASSAAPLPGTVNGFATSLHPAITAEALTAAGLIEPGSLRRKAADEFRLVQHQLVRLAFPADGGQDGFSNLLMVTSAKPREGKTFTALNLAAGLARQGDRPVLLVDADPKQASLSDKLGLMQFPGLIELASDPGRDPLDLLHATEFPLMSILPAGGLQTARSELFLTEQTVRALQSLGRRFPERLIVIDMSPCLSTSDPSALAPYVGQTVFVVEAESTQREEVEAALDVIQSCASITLLLNKVRMSTPRSFGAYSYAYTS